MTDDIKLIRSKKHIKPSIYSAFLNRFNMKNGLEYIPHVPIPEFIRKNKENHNQLTAILGGETIKYKIVVRVTQEPMEDDQCAIYQKEIIKILPQFFNHYGLNYAILRYPLCKYNIVVAGKNKPRQINTGKFIMGYADRFCKLSTQQKIDLHKIVQTLGQKWAKLKNFDKEYLISISTSPIAFTMIGHYGPDNNSCFRHGKENWRHKFKLASEYKNTFVFLIKEKTMDNKYRVISRQWGFYNDGMFNICNLYMIKLQDTIVEKINHKIFEMLSKQEMRIHKNLIAISRDKVYHNTQKHDWTFAEKSIKQIKEQTLVS